ncbi:hypothetical protein P7C73_g5714, partial [Tremellales sp. Uapishka_1]
MLPLILLLHALSASAACPVQLSCSSAASKLDTCCTPSPAGLFVFKQRFEPDVHNDSGSWGIDGLEVLDCTSQKPAQTVYSPAHTHEEIGSYCHKSSVFGEKGFYRAEGDWASSEVGEGVEEVWERTWNTAGRYISTLQDKCVEGNSDENVPLFFHTLQELHTLFRPATLLSDADITPSSDTTYSLAELTLALAFDDYKPVISCENTTLSSVLWPLVVKGTFQTGAFSAAPSFSPASNCPVDGIIYPSTTTTPEPTPVHTWDPVFRPSPRPITLSHDESKQYQYDQEETKKLGFFKDSDEGREGGKEGRRVKQWHRDEL